MCVCVSLSLSLYACLHVSVCTHECMCVCVCVCVWKYEDTCKTRMRTTLHMPVVLKILRGIAPGADAPDPLEFLSR